MIISKLYFNGIYQGQTQNLYWVTSTFNLQYGHIYNWRVDVVDTTTNQTTTGDTWAFATKASPSPINFERPPDYPPDKVWAFDPGTNEYAWVETPDIIVAGGGKYASNLVVIGQDVDINGIIYYQTIYDDPEPENGYAIIGSDWNGESASTLYISGDHAAEFLNQSYTITDSSNGNNETYSSGFDGVYYNSEDDRTEIVCDPAVANEPIDGILTVI